MFYCYILYSEELDKYYIGATADVSGRLRRHLSHHKGFTGKAPDWILKWKQKFTLKTDAIKREKQIKAWKSRSMIERLIEKSNGTLFNSARPGESMLGSYSYSHSESSMDKNVCGN